MQSNQKLNAQILLATAEAKSALDHGLVVLTSAEMKLVSGGAPKSFWAPEAQVVLAPKSFW